MPSQLLSCLKCASFVRVTRVSGVGSLRFVGSSGGRPSVLSPGCASQARQSVSYLPGPKSVVPSEHSSDFQFPLPDSIEGISHAARVRNVREGWHNSDLIECREFHISRIYQHMEVVKNPQVLVRPFPPPSPPPLPECPPLWPPPPSTSSKAARTKVSSAHMFPLNSRTRRQVPTTANLSARTTARRSGDQRMRQFFTPLDPCVQPKPAAGPIRSPWSPMRSRRPTSSLSGKFCCPSAPPTSGDRSCSQSTLRWRLPGGSRYANNALAPPIISLTRSISRRIQYLSRSQVWIYFRTPGISLLSPKCFPVISCFGP